MEASQSSGAVTTWSASGNPDNDVHNSFGIRAAMSELYLNTNNNFLFFCLMGVILPLLVLRGFAW